MDGDTDQVIAVDEGSSHDESTFQDHTSTNVSNEEPSNNNSNKEEESNSALLPGQVEDDDKDDAVSTKVHSTVIGSSNGGRINSTHVNEGDLSIHDVDNEPTSIKTSDNHKTSPQILSSKTPTDTMASPPQTTSSVNGEKDSNDSTSDISDIDLDSDDDASVSLHSEEEDGKNNEAKDEAKDDTEDVNNLSGDDSMLSIPMLGDETKDTNDSSKDNNDEDDEDKKGDVEKDNETTSQQLQQQPSEARNAHPKSNGPLLSRFRSNKIAPMDDENSGKGNDNSNEDEKKSSAIAPNATSSQAWKEGEDEQLQKNEPDKADTSPSSPSPPTIPTATTTTTINVLPKQDGTEKDEDGEEKDRSNEDSMQDSAEPSPPPSKNELEDSVKNPLYDKEERKFTTMDGTYVPLDSAKAYIATVLKNVGNTYSERTRDLTTKQYADAIKSEYERRVQICVQKATEHSSQLKGKIAGLVKVVKSLQAQNKTLSESISQVSSTSSEEKPSIQPPIPVIVSSKHETGISQEEKDAFTKELTESKQQYQTLESTLAEKEKLHKDELLKIQKELDEKKALADSANEEIGEARKEIARLERACVEGAGEEAVKEMERMQEKVEAAQKAHDDAIEKVVALQGSHDNIEARLTASEASHEEEIDQLEKQIEELKGDNESLQEKLKALVESEHQENGGKEAEQKEGEGKEEDAQKDTEIEATPITDDSKEKKEEQKQTKKQSQPQRRTPRTKKTEESQQKSSSATDSKKIRQLEAQLNDSAATVKKLEDKLAQAKTSSLELQKQQKEIKDLQKKLDLYQKDRNKSSNAVEELQEERDALTKANKKLEEEMKQLNLEVKAAKSSAANMEELEEKHKDLKAKFKVANAEATKFKENFEEERKKRKKLHNIIEDMKGKIRVFCRIRPMSRRELDDGQTVAVTPLDDFTVSIMGKHNEKEYEFDNVFQFNCTQDQVYEDTHNLIQSTLDGYNVCVFAYGQTGSGKTFTMIGDENVPMQYPGLAPRAFKDIFNSIEEQTEQFERKVSCYMIELYRDKPYDLLDPGVEKTIEVRMLPGKAVEIRNVKIEEAANADELMEIFERGSSGRRTKSTNMNASSSRSHLIIAILVESKNLATGKTFKAKLSLVDLAGSERSDRVGGDADTQAEGNSINQSLTALGNVITALATNSSYIPYRNNLLTSVMKDSLGGDSKTLMFVNVSPASSNTTETRSSLDYAKRVQAVTNNATKNEQNDQMDALKKTTSTMADIILRLRKGDEVSQEELDALNLG